MATQSKGPARLWLLVPHEDATSVVALNSDFPDVHVGTAEGEPFASLARELSMAALLVGEKYGSYSGIIGGRPLLSRYAGLDEAAIRKRIRRKHPKWSDSKVTRAVRDILENEDYNALTDHAKRDYKRMWEFLCRCVRVSGEAVLVYDPNRTTNLEERVPSSLVLRQRIADAHHVPLDDHDSTALYSIRPHEFYLFKGS